MRYFLSIWIILIAPTLLHSQDIGKASRIGKDFALFFAVNEYKHSDYRKLENPIKNAHDIAKELERNYGFTPEVVENPTLETIVRTLKRYSNFYAEGKYDPEGQLFIFFTGHGVSENKNGYFLPKDANPESIYNTGWSYDYWREFIDGFNCKHILVAIDACFSGTFDPEWWDPKKSGNNTDPWKRPGEYTTTERLLENHKEYVTRLFITSGTEEQTPDRSRFTWQILEGLRSRSSLHIDGIFTFSEMWTYLELANPRPHRGSFGKDEASSNFLFITDPSEVESSESNSLYTLDFSTKVLSDHRDHKQYRIIQIGNMVWMAENMRFDVGSDNWCYAENAYNCNTYGRLYTWEKATQACRGLGDGWRLPTKEEWRKIIDNYASSYVAFQRLKSGGQSEFNLKFGGTRLADGSYSQLNKLGNYWSDSSKNEQFAFYYYLSDKNKKIYQFYANKTEGQSCRCVLEIGND